VKPQSDILFAIGTWVISSTLFMVTYNFLPAPPAEFISVTLPVSTEIEHFTIRASGHCIGYATTSLFPGKTPVLSLEFNDTVAIEGKSALGLSARIKFGEDNLLETISGKIITPSTRLRVASTGSSPIQISLTGKIDGKSIADVVEIPGPVSLIHSEELAAYALSFPRKGLFRSGLLEYARGALTGNFSFTPSSSAQNAECKKNEFTTTDLENLTKELSSPPFRQRSDSSQELPHD
jgi:hypothetical protein